MKQINNRNIKKRVREISSWFSLYMIKMGYHIDFKIESYKELDRFFDEHSSDKLLKDNNAYIFAIGGYIGEVLRRVYRGKWSCSSKIDFENLGDRDISIKLKNNKIVYPLEIVSLRMQNKMLIEDIDKIQAD